MTPKHTVMETPATLGEEILCSEPPVPHSAILDQTYTNHPHKEPEDRRTDILITRVIQRLHIYASALAERPEEEPLMSEPRMPGFEHPRVRQKAVLFTKGGALYRNKAPGTGVHVDPWPYDGLGLYQHPIQLSEVRSAIWRAHPPNKLNGAKNQRGLLGRILRAFRRSSDAPKAPRSAESRYRMPNSAVPHPIWLLPYNSDRNSLASDDDDGDIELFLRQRATSQQGKSQAEAKKPNKRVKDFTNASTNHLPHPPVLYINDHINDDKLLRLDDTRSRLPDSRHYLVSTWVRIQEGTASEDPNASLEVAPMTTLLDEVAWSLTVQPETSQHASIHNLPDGEPRELVSFLPSMSSDTCNTSLGELADTHTHSEAGLGTFGELTAPFFPSMTPKLDFTVLQHHMEGQAEMLDHAHALTSSDEEGSGWKSQSVSPITPHLTALDSSSHTDIQPVGFRDSMGAKDLNTPLLFVVNQTP
ncbi:hypothetical protein FRB93_001656 [Tulasnella sp. JGI-2019a]|nr:hypothetical protein FRB93_001656 [Tulasnella sp. JGI-2019a]